MPSPGGITKTQIYTGDRMGKLEDMFSTCDLSASRVTNMADLTMCVWVNPRLDCNPPSSDSDPLTVCCSVHHVTVHCYVELPY